MIYDEEKARKNGFIIGLIVGVLTMLFFWIMIADRVEMSKVKDGYLTLKNKTYKVILYDTLDTPEDQAQ